MSADATDSETKLKVERKDVAMYLSRLLIVVSPLALAPEDVTAGTIQYRVTVVTVVTNT